MGKGLKTDRIDTPKIILLVMAEFFTAASLVAVIMDGEWTRIALTAVTLLFVPLPLCIEYLFRKKLTLLSFGIGIAYSIGPMLGHAYNLYTILPWWDKMLHMSAGVIFALLGIELARKLFRGRDIDSSYLLLAIFGLCCSMALSVAWEFVEYGLDLWLGLDTQTDTVIHTIVSATLGRDAGIAEPVTNINDVIVGGRSLGLGGYLDIGLIDTMHDLMIESLGAVIAAIPVIVRKGRHTVFRREK
jgi:uncharacterized membrane protein YjdF